MRHLAYISLALVCLLAVVSCGDDGTVRERHRQAARIDSALTGAPIDTLLVHTTRYEATGDKVGLMIACKHLGKAYRNSSQFENAIKVHTQGLNAARDVADTVEMVRALNNLGTDMRRIGSMEEAAAYHYKALGLCEAMGDQESDMAVKNRVVSLNGIGNIHMTLGNYAVADSVFRLALAGEHRLGSALGQAINCANLGAIKEERGDIDSAWHYYRRSLRLNEQAGSEVGVSLCHTHFGQLYERDGMLDNAVREYEIAHDMMRDGKDMWHYLEACQALAQVHIKRHDAARAARYIARADSISMAIGSLEHRAECYRLKYLLAREQGNDRAALDYYVAADRLKDSVVSVTNSGQMMNLRMNLERERSRGQIDLLNSNYEAARRTAAWTIAIAVLLTVLAVLAIAFLWYSLRLRARNQRLMDNIEQARSAFFTNITHEFRTPLTVIMGLAQELKSATPDGAQRVRGHAAVIERQGGVLLSLINQLLDVSRISTAPTTPDWRHGDITLQVSMIAENHRELCRAKHIDLLLRMSESPLLCDFVPIYLQRIVGNLLGNAIKFTGNYGRITVAVSREGSTVTIAVSDTGRGIAPADVDHIFDPFYQGSNARHGDMGTGVGLALVSHMTRAMNGTIAVQSEPEKGSTFTVTLPLKHGDVEYSQPDDDMTLPLTGTPVETTLDDATAGDDDNAALRVLIIEDHNDVAYYIGSQLAQPCEVYYASSGDEGFVKAAQLVPDIIITDVMMPDGDGLELCRKLRNSSALSHIPIIVISARSTRTDRMAAIEAGADVYMVKPFDGDELRLRVAKLLEMRRLLHVKYTSTGSDLQLNASTTSSDVAFIEHFVELVNAELDKGSRGSVNIENMARTMGMNTAQLRRKVLALTGLKAMTYVTQLRMDRAKHLLERFPSMPIGEVAERCGFADISHFSRIFKLKHGVSPTQFRSRQGE